MGLFGNKKPTRPNNGMVSCDWPGCTYEHEKPAMVMAHKVKHVKENDKKKG